MPSANMRGPSESGRGGPQMPSGFHVCRVGTQDRCHACVEREPETNPVGDGAKSTTWNREQCMVCDDHFF